MTRYCPKCKRPCTDYNADYCLCGADLPDPKFVLRDSAFSPNPRDYDDKDFEINGY